jgi:hypothetical protein
MAYFKTLISISPILFLCYCSPSTNTGEQASVSLETLEGSWRRVSEKNQETGEWEMVPSNVINQKYLSATHFCWVNYDIEQDSLLGTGGGTYAYDAQSATYTEDIKFFLPAGSQLLGQAIPFEVKYENGQWFHTGYAKLFEFDPETGENVITDSAKIEEIWERTDAPLSQDGLVGTWQLESYKGEGDSLRSEYPDFVSYVKLITPTHFVWVHYLSEGDQVLAEGGGTYTYNGDTYTETLKFVYPSGSGQVGTVLPFDCKIEGDTWYHTGYIIMKDENDQPADSARIDEVWKPFTGLGS